MKIIVPLFLAFAMALVGGCKKQPETVRATLHTEEAAVHKLVKKHVKDSDREDRLLHLIDQNRSGLVEIKVAFYDMADQLRNKPNMTREEMDSLNADFKATRELILDEIAQRLVEMRKYTTEEEWNAIQAGLAEKREKRVEKAEKQAEKAEPETGKEASS